MFWKYFFSFCLCVLVVLSSYVFYFSLHAFWYPARILNKGFIFAMVCSCCQQLTVVGGCCYLRGMWMIDAFVNISATLNFVKNLWFDEKFIDTWIFLTYKVIDNFFFYYEEMCFSSRSLKIQDSCNYLCWKELSCIEIKFAIQSNSK